MCSTYERIWFYKIFFYILELVVSNTRILMSKSTADAPTMLQFRESDCATGKWEDISPKR